MNISDEQVRHVAKLSRLQLDDAHIHPFAQQLSDVLNYVEKLNELDLDGVEPMAHAMDVTNVWREDEMHGGLSPEQALSNAPQQEPPFFRVPKVIADGGGA